MRLLRVCLVLAAASTAVSVLRAQTVGTIPKFTGQQQFVTDSVITESSGKIGVGVSTPGVKFEVGDGSGKCVGLNPANANGDPEISTCSYDLSVNAYEFKVNGTALHVNRFGNTQFGIASESDNVNRLYVDGQAAFMNGMVGIGTTTPASFLTVAPAATLSGTSSTENFLTVTGTFNATNSTAVAGARIDITSAGSSAFAQRAFHARLNAGFTGTTGTIAGLFHNLAGGLGTLWQPGGTGGANYGIWANATGTTAGHNVGILANAIGSQTFNAGTIAAAVDGSNGAARNVGVAGFARNASTANVAGYFGLGDQVIAADASAVLLADNGPEAAPIFVGRDNGSELFRIADGGNVGVGTAAPGYKIDVQGGQVNASGGLCIAGDCRTSWAGANLWSSSGADVSFSGGKVGIGTSAPHSTLTIAPGVPPSGTSNIHTFLSIIGTLNPVNTAIANGARVSITSAGSSSTPQRAIAVNLFAGYTGSSETVGIIGYNQVAGLGDAAWTAGAANYGVKGQSYGASLTGMNVGVKGLALNSQTLNIGSAGFATSSDNTPLRNVGVAGFAASATTANVAGFFGLMTAAPVVDASAALVADNGDVAAPVLVARDNGSEVMRVADGGNLGLGTSAPGYKIDVQGGQVNASGGLCIAGDCRTSWAGASLWSSSGANVSFSGGNVGIGTATPDSRLNIVDSTADTGFLISNTTATAGAPGQIRMRLAPQNQATQQEIVAVDGRLGFLTGGVPGSTAASERFSISDTGSVGIGTTAPTGRLSVVRGGGGYATAASNYVMEIVDANNNGNGFGYWASDGTTTSQVFALSVDNVSNRNGLLSLMANGTQKIRFDASSGASYINAGNVGIGTAAPSQRLQVNTTAADEGFALYNDTTGRSVSSITRASSSADVGVFRLFSGGSTTVLLHGEGGAPSYVNTGGHLGVGTSSPSYRLDVQGGQVNASDGLCIAGTCKTSWADASQWTTSSGNIGFATGDVGIGTTAPSARLDVASGHLLISSNNHGLIFKGNGGTGVFTSSGGNTLNFATNDVGDRMVIADNGNVGIGTTAPAQKLDVSTDLQNGFAARFVQSNATQSNGVAIVTGTASAGDAAFLINSNGGANPVVMVRNSGAVGIGTTSPDAASKLHVAGNIKVDGNINAKYQDVAEWVESDERLEAGTVVIADPDSDNRVQTAATPYDTAVAGVVSAQPGVLLGEAGDGKVAVAQSGRVLVKVDASFGAIKRGDLLVASSTPGHAMRSEAVELGGITMHRPGTIIGKALGALDSGQGQILVLLTLQ